MFYKCNMRLPPRERIKLPRGKRVSVNKFTGSDLNVFLGMVGLYRKHKSLLCYPHGKHLDRYGIQWDCNKDKRELILPESFWVDFQECTKKFIAIPLTLFNGHSCDIKDSNAHMNLLLFDTTQKVVERFDPLGDYKGYEADVLDKRLKGLFRLHNYKYIKPTNTCPLQHIQIQHFPGNSTDTGYCAAWSMFYLDLRLSNPNTEATRLKHLARTKLVETTQMTDYIRGYAMYIYNKRRNLINYIQQKYSVVITMEELDIIDEEHDQDIEKWVIKALLDKLRD